MEDDLPSVDDNSEIKDLRRSAEFRGTTFSNYKKTTVRKNLIDSMLHSKVEPACYWSIELICAGHFAELWDIFLQYVGKHIHIGNPKIVIYLERRFEMFRSIMDTANFTDETQLRNHPTIRQMFAEIVSTLSISPRKHTFEHIKIKREEEFDMTQMKDRLKADDVTYASEILRGDDPKELFVSINELSYHLSPLHTNTVEACYWIEWIIEFDAICKKRKQECKCQTRGKTPVDNKYNKDIIWIVWDALFYYAILKQNPFIEQLITSIYNLFCIKYTTAMCKKRRYLLYFAVAIIVEHVPNNIELMPNKNTITTVMKQINILYKQVKKNEIKPSTEYLFANMEKENEFEKSMIKLNLVNSVDIFNNK